MVSPKAQQEGVQWVHVLSSIHDSAKRIKESSISSSHLTSHGHVSGTSRPMSDSLQHACVHTESTQSPPTCDMARQVRRRVQRRRCTETPTSPRKLNKAFLPGTGLFGNRILVQHSAQAHGVSALTPCQKQSMHAHVPGFVFEKSLTSLPSFVRGVSPPQNLSVSPNLLYYSM